MYQFFLKGQWWLVVLVICSIKSYGQKNNLDSLRERLSTTEGVAKIDLLYELAYNSIIAEQKSEALDFAEKSFELAVEAGDSLRMVKAIRVKGSALRRLERINEAIDISTKGLSIAQRNNFSNERKILLNSIAICYTFKADYDNALDYLFESLLVRELEGNKKEISITLNNIGLVFFKLKDYENAIRYYERSLTLKREANDNYDVDRLLINLGLCYIQAQGAQSKYRTARDYISEALAACEPNCSDPILMEANFGLGMAFFQLNEDRQAQMHFETSLEIAKKTDTKRFIAENLLFLAKISTRQGEIDKALASLTETENLAVSSGYNHLLIDCYTSFANLYEGISDYKNAAHYQRRYIILKDSLFSEELIKNISKVQTDYAERENIKTIADKEEVIRQQQKITFAIIIIAILATLLIIVLFRSNKTKKRVNAALSEAKAIIEDQNKQLLNSNIHLNRELEERNVDLEKANESLQRVNEELDNFIYKTSHDIRGPLASLKGMCNVALIDVQDPIALSYLHKLDITADKLNTILTRLLIVNQINHSAIASDRIDFHEILNDVLLIEKKKGLPPNLSIRRNVQDDIDFYSDQEFIRLILSNLIGNAIKFYNDKDGAEPFVIISIAAFDAHIHLRVIDNGIGIKKVDRNKIFQIFSRGSERSETGGIGLYITKTAVEKLGGSIRLQTTMEGYTEFYIQLPMVIEQVPAE